ncbi:MAG: hypothetical protein VB817_05115 [Pirellulaceae bacterium]
MTIRPGPCDRTCRGMYWDRGKSSPKIAHGAHAPFGTGRAHVYRLMDMVDMALEIGDADPVDEVLELEYGFFGR